ncbi:MAG: CPBP family intramembrane metalloprotease [Actinomycetota bacterium]|nr:CPBP family intramembrane metalloprotease [Actinomycetota bacterium]
MDSPSDAHPGPPTPAPGAPTATPPWRPFSGVLAVLAALLVATVLGGLLLAPFGAQDPPPEALVGATFLQDLIFIGAALLFAALARRPRADDFGLLAPRRTGQALGLAAGVYVAFTVLSGLWVTALGIDERQTTLDQLGVDEGVLNLLLGIVIVTLMAPVAEELLFRGYVFTALRNWRGVGPAAVVSGAIFGFIHFGSSPLGFLVPLALFGVGLALLYAWTRSLYPSIGLHAVNNSVAFAVAQQWHEDAPLLLAGLVVGATTVSLLVAAALGRALGSGPLAPRHPAPAAA